MEEHVRSAENRWGRVCNIGLFVINTVVSSFMICLLGTTDYPQKAKHLHLQVFFLCLIMAAFSQGPLFPEA